MTQERNAELVDILRADFQHRLEPNFAWKSACSVFLALTGLRGFWPLSGCDSAGDATDLGGLDLHLSNSNVADFSNAGLVPYVSLDGVNQYLAHVDHANFDILGTEAYIESSLQGLTIGGWFWHDDAAGAVEQEIGKWDAAGADSYAIRREATGVVRFNIYDGIGYDNVPGIDPGQNVWVFLVGRYEPSTEITLFMNNTIYTNAVGIPAALNNSNSDFTIGSTSVPSNHLDGRASMCFLCASRLEDSTVNAIYQQTRAMYGV